MKQQINASLVALFLCVSAEHVVAGGGHHVPPPPPPTPAPIPVPQSTVGNVLGVAAPYGSVNGTLGQNADLAAQQKLEAALSAQQTLNAENTAHQSAATQSGPANTTSGPASTKSGNIDQEVNGSAGNNTLKSISEGGNSSLNGSVNGTNQGTFTNDGRQNMAVDARGGNTNIGPVSSSSTASSASNSAGGAGGKGGAGGAVDNSGNSRSTSGIDRSGNSSANTGASTATGNGAGNSTNITTNTVYKHIEVPVLFNPVPPSSIAGSGFVTHVFTCGPLLRVDQSAVIGTYVGILTNTEINLGQDMGLAPILDANGKPVRYEEETYPDGVTRRFGSQAFVTTALVQVSGARTLSIGFAGSDGGANGGAGSSSAMSRIVTKVIIAPCELPGAYRVSTEKIVVGITKADLEEALRAVQVPTAPVVVKKPYTRRHVVIKKDCGCDKAQKK